MHDGETHPEKQSPGADMRRRILDAAARSLAENGYQATTLRGLAQAAGLKAGSIYYHFSAKEEITVEVLNEGVELVAAAVRDAVAALPDSADGRAILAAAIDAHLEALSAHRAYTRASIRCFSMVPEEIRARTRESRQALDGLWLGILEQAGEAGAISTGTDLRVLHRILIGALNWTIEQRGDGAAANRALRETLLNLITR